MVLIVQLLTHLNQRQIMYEVFSEGVPVVQQDSLTLADLCEVTLLLLAAARHYGDRLVVLREGACRREHAVSSCQHPLPTNQHTRAEQLVVVR